MFQHGPLIQPQAFYKAAMFPCRPLFCPRAHAPFFQKEEQNKSNRIVLHSERLDIVSCLYTLSLSRSSPEFPKIAACHVDDNISTSNYTKCASKRWRVSLCMTLMAGAARRSASGTAGRHRPAFSWVSACMAALIGCDYRGQGPIRGHLRVKRVVQ